jgi:DNA-binding transcriptional MerR regulator
VSLLSIGEFAARSGLSPKALRLYDELALLLPVQVDADSGYRWYDPEQLEAARLVAALRQIGVPLAMAKVLLAMSATEAAQRLSEYWTEVEREHAAHRELADHLVQRLLGKRPAVYDVLTREVPARRVFSVQRHGNGDELTRIGRNLIGRLRELPRPEADGTGG